MTGYSFKFNSDAIAEFKRQFPCSGIPELDSITFEFDWNGDLVDIIAIQDGQQIESAEFDGAGLLALSQDAKDKYDTEPIEWSAGSGRPIIIAMTMAQAESCSHSGQCYEDVKALAKVPTIAEQLARIDPDTLRLELKEYGAWDAQELADHDANLLRMLWCACNDLKEENYSK